MVYAAISEEVETESQEEENDDIMDWIFGEEMDDSDNSGGTDSECEV